MALFKILKGNEANLPSTKHEGWAYVTEKGNMYVDLSNDKRVKIGNRADTAEYADKATGDTQTIRSRYLARIKQVTSDGTQFTFRGETGDGTNAPDLISIPLAGDKAGLVSNAAQTIKGEKTFANGIKFPDVTSTTYPAVSAGLTWSGSTDGAKIYYEVQASDKGMLIIEARDDTNAGAIFRNSNSKKEVSIINGLVTGAFKGNLTGTASHATSDANGKNIASYVASVLAQSDNRTIRVTKGDGTTNDVKLYFAASSSFGGAADSANVLNINNTENIGVGRMQFFQKSGDATLMPDTNWWSLVRLQHGGYASTGYWTEMAYAFHSDTIKFRRNQNGTKSAWKTIAFTDGTIAKATQAEKDWLGQVIDETYMKYPLSISGEVITMTRGDGVSSTITVPDTKVTQSETTTANYRPIILGYTNTTDTTKLSASTRNQVYASNKFYAQPSTGTLVATTFKGALDGNAKTATDATYAEKAKGDTTTIRSTYVSSVTKSGVKVVVKKGDGTSNEFQLDFLPLAGGTMIGNIAFSKDNVIQWSRNTDFAKIGFKNDSDSDADSYMYFHTGDNGNEYFKFRITSGSTVTDVLNIKNGAATFNGTVTATKFIGALQGTADYADKAKGDTVSIQSKYVSSVLKKSGSNYVLRVTKGDGTYNDVDLYFAASSSCGGPANSANLLNTLGSKGSNSTTTGTYTKFATVNVSAGAWVNNSIFMFVSDSEANNFSGLIRIHFRSSNTIASTSISMYWLTISNRSYAGDMYAVKTADGVYDLYWYNRSNYMSLNFSVIRGGSANISFVSNSTVSSITAAAQSSLGGQVNYANSAGSATNDSAGANIRSTYIASIKQVTSNGTTFTFRGYAGDGSEKNNLITIPAASASVAGLITNTAQSLKGDKTLVGKLIVETTGTSATTKSSTLRLRSSESGSGGAVGMEFWRGTSASWQIVNDGGKLYFRNNYTSSALSSYSQNSLVLSYSTGAGTIPYLGINGENLDYRLNVNGSSYFDGTVEIQGITTHHANIQLDATARMRRNGRSANWNQANTYAMITMDTVSGWSPFLAQKTANGWWTMGHYNADKYYDHLLFGFLSNVDVSGVANAQNHLDYTVRLLPTIYGSASETTTNRAFVTAPYASNKAVVGTATKPVYVNDTGVVTACTYELKATLNSGSANRLPYYSSATAISQTSHFANTTQIGINTTNTTNISSYNLYVEGTSKFNGNTYHNGVDYFANGTTYYINNSAHANLRAVGSSDNTFIMYPQGGGFRTSKATKTGYLKITLPQSWTNTMMSFKIQIYEYQTGYSCEYVVGGYNYSSTWANRYFAYSTGKNDQLTHSNLTVRFGHDGSKCAIYIGESNTSWSYPQVQVHSMIAGYSNYGYDKWASGWKVDFTTSLGTVTAVVEKPHVSYRSSQVYVTNTNSDTSMRLYFGYAGSSYRDVYSDENLTYNPGTNTLYCANVIQAPYIYGTTHGYFGNYNNTSYTLSTASFISNDWVRTNGSTGWYSQTYGGGIHMTDSTWVRTYNNKSFYCSQIVQAGARIYTGWDSGNNGSVSCSNWFRSNGSTGWYNQTYNGGIYMTDSTFVRVSHSKRFKTDNAIHIYPTEGNYSEGLRIYSYGSWSDILLCGNDMTATTGTSANSWFIGNNNGTFNIVRNGSSTGTAYLRCVSNKWYINTTTGGEQLNVGGWVGTVGNAGWHSLTHGGGWYMTDTSWVRSYNNKGVYTGGEMQAGTIRANSVLRSQGHALIYSNSNNAAYTSSAIEIREYNVAGAQTGAWSEAPSLTFHWGGRVQRQIRLHNNGWLYCTNDNFSTAHRLVLENGGSWNIKANTAGTSDWANYLVSNNRMAYGWNGLNYFNASMSASGAAGANNSPTADWYHIIRMNHGNSGGYYCDIATCFHNNNMYLKRVANGSSSGWLHIWVQGNSVTSAVWNDYAECRKSDSQEPGYVMFEKGNDSLSKTIERLQHFAGIVSDTWGFSQGETADAKTNIAVAGRVLAYPYRDRNEYKPGDCVCAAPGGKVDIMTREEIVQYPDRIVGTVSCVPEYEEWGGGEGADRDPVKVNGRIWIKVK